MFKLKTILQGFVMGVAEIIPGVSGSTLALAMGIYDEFINLLFSVSEFIKSLFKFITRKISFADLKQSFFNIQFVFGFYLVFGMAIAIALLAGVLSGLLVTNRYEVYAFFFGLVLTSIYLPYKEVGGFRLKEILVTVVTFVVFFVLFNISSVHFDTLPSPLYFLVGGMLAISAMVLPGVSGSFIMVLLGIYDFILGFIKKLLSLSITGEEFTSLVFFTFGVAFGFIFFVRLLKYTLKHYSSIVFSFLVGIMLASLKVLWPFETDTSSPLALVILIAIGGSVTFLIMWVSNQSNKDSIHKV
jgi:putative membrane protein